MRISAIAIISKNRGLGKDNKLLFHIPGELPRLKQITMGHPLIMGRKTYESIGHPLPGRLNVVITKDVNFKAEGVVVVHSLQEAIQEGIKYYVSSSKYEEKEKSNIPNTQYLIRNTEQELFILGGGQIFKEALPLTDRLYLTIVDTEVPADVFFPEYEKEFTKVIEKEEKTDWEYPYRFLTLEKEN
ncbi:MAG TPA: dihydrofolate reductase [Candidatus Eisenbacteria bacterium]|nr:dihydrofolate reductase [Candidatus Eisenbacteria bacterium]